MSEEGRWDEDGAPAEVAELLRAGRAEAPRTRIVSAALAAAGTLALSAKGSAALTFASIAKWGVSGIALGSLVSLGGAAARYASAPSPAPTSATTTVLAAPITMMSSLPAIEAPAPAPTEPMSAPNVRAPVPRGAAPARSTNAGRRLEEEIALVDAIRAAVDAKEPSRALGLLETHDRRFGRAAPLAPEARYLRMEALRLAGKADAARDVAREITNGDANVPHRERAKTLLDQAPSDPAREPGR